MSDIDRSKNTKARRGAFISYARSDGERFASELRNRLEVEGVPLWQDRAGMEGGRDWWLQITEALNNVEFMILVMTPNAMRSDTVRKEWRYARQQGVCVYPVKGIQDLSFASLPRWMRDAHFYDIEFEWNKFINDLNTRCQTPRVPFMVEDLLEGFIPRPMEFEQLLTNLLDRTRDEPVAITAALRGAGGYGKTTLAKALCHHEAIQDAFDDGILWVTLGENVGDLTARVEDLIYILSNERPGFAGIDAATVRLVELLADRDMLIVIDDVWNAAHLKPFLQGGPRCARLITSRIFDALPPNAERIDVDAMHQSEAVALLGSGLPPGFEDELSKLASRLGEWPILLKLVNRTLHHRIINIGQAIPDALSYINKALDKRGMTFFDARNATNREQAVAQTLNVSFELLTQNERTRYAELAIFPEDVNIPLSTVEKFWKYTGGLDEFDTEALCDRLNSFSLLYRFDPTRRYIRLHDVMRKYLIHEQRDNLRVLHNSLLDAHRLSPPHLLVSEQTQDWSQLPTTEPYLWDYLAYHLTEAGNEEELVATVKNLKYVVTKTFLRKSLAIEADLLAAERSADLTLRLLRRTIIQSGHILNRCNSINSLAATLYSRLQHLELFLPLTNSLIPLLTPPTLRPWRPMPDLAHFAILRTLSGHTGVVNDCAISLDNSYIVSASRDRTLKVWDAITGGEALTLRGHTNTVKACAISRDGSLIISASDDRTLKLWSTETGATLHTLSGHTGVVWDCALSHDGSFIVSASYDKTLRIWDALTGETLRVLEGHTQSVQGCAVSPDGSFIVSASYDKTLKVWETQTGTTVNTLHGHKNAVVACAISPDGSFIVSASRDNTLKVWDASTGAERLTLSGHTEAVTDCAISPDGSLIISASEDRTMRIWATPSKYTPPTKYTSPVLLGHKEWVQSCAVSLDGSLIVSTSDDKTLKIWDTKDLLQRDTFHGHTRSVLGCAISPDSSFVVTASKDRTLRVWNINNGTERFTLYGHRDWVRGCAVSPDGSFIVSASYDKTLKVWDTTTGEPHLTLAGHTDAVVACAVSPDGSFIVSASRDNTLKVWDASTGAERLTLSGHVGSVQGCAITADGALVVSASWDNTLKVWDAKTGNQRLTLSGHKDGVQFCAISPDHSYIVSASWDKTLKLWDLNSGSLLHTLTGHQNAVLGCSVSPDGSYIISASADNTLRIWNLESEPEVRTALYGHSDSMTLYGHSDSVRGCATSSDGSFAVSSSSDRTIKIWDIRNVSNARQPQGHRSSVVSCALRADGFRAVTASRDKTLIIWDTQTGKIVRTLNGPKGFTACAMSPDGTLITASSDDTHLTLFGSESELLQLIHLGHKAAVTDCAISSDGSFIVSASWDRTLKVWDIRTGEIRLTLEGHTNPVVGCAISPDNSFIVSASWDKTLKIWDATTGAQRSTLTGHQEWVKSCAVSLDGSFIASTSYDQTLKVWDTFTGEARLTFIGHEAPVTGCAISSNDTFIASVSEDNSLKIWDIRQGGCIASLYVDGALNDCVWFPDNQHILAVGQGGTYFIEFIP